MVDSMFTVLPSIFLDKKIKIPFSLISFKTTFVTILILSKNYKYE